MIVRGPFTIKWGENTLLDIEELNIDYEVESDDYETVKGKVFELDKATKVSVTLTLLSTDIAALALVLPQYFVPEGGSLSSGDVVSEEIGAIDIVPHKCNPSMLYNDLDIISCGNPSQTTRILRTRTKIEGFDISNRLQKIRVRFVCEPLTNNANVQILRNDTHYYFLLDNGQAFFTNDGHVLTV